MKLVKEYIIFEKFTQDSDPIKDLGIGHIHLIKEWLDKQGIEHYKILKNGKINVFGNLNLDLNGDFPEYIQFYHVYGYVNIGNCNLTTLKGCPVLIDGWFSCNDNRLTTLKYGPKRVQIKRQFNTNYECNGNILTSLKGLPKTLPGNLWVFNNAKKFTHKDVKDAGCSIPKERCSF